MSISDCVFLFISMRCNLSCSHCYVSSVPDKGKEMDFTVVERSFDLFTTLGIRDFRITGGEPTTHPQFKKIVSFLFANNIRLGLVTNGTKLFNTNMIDMLPMFSRCWVSVYGLTARNHHLVSGVTESKFNQLLNQVGKSATRGHPIGVSAILAPGDKALVSDFIELVYSKGIRRLRFIPLEPDGRAGTLLNVDWGNWGYEVRSIYEEIRKHHLLRSFETISINDPFDMNDQYESPDSSCLLKHRRMWSITPGGEIYPCCFNVPPVDTKVIAKIQDVNVEQKIKVFSDGLAGGSISCRGLSSTYWGSQLPQRISCPISALKL